MNKGEGGGSLPPAPAPKEESMARKPRASKRATHPAPERKVEAAPAAASRLVRMSRNGKFADVHPSEVDNFKGGGWELAP